MERNLEFISRVYDRMKEMGFVFGQAQFSEKWLGKGPSYLSSSKAKGRAVPDRVIDHFEEQIKERANRARRMLDLYTDLSQHQQELLAIIDIHRLERKLPDHGDEEHVANCNRQQLEESRRPAEQIRSFLDKLTAFKVF